MQTDVEIKITGGLPFDETAVSGISIFYGINSIPTVNLELDAAYIQSYAPSFLCNPDDYKNRSIQVNVEIKSKTGCINFDGFFDGLSVSQLTGSISYSAVLKNKFQRLLEIYPRAFGVIPTSFDIFTDPDQFMFQHGDPVKQYVSFQAADAQAISTDGKIPEYIKAILKMVVDTQYVAKTLTNFTEDGDDLLKLMKDSYLKNLQESQNLISRLDISYISDCAIESSICADEIMNILLGREFTDLWSLIVHAFSFLGCCVVVGNDQFTVLPETKFLSFDHPVPDFQSTTIKTNCANPGQYNSFSTSDTGRNNIKAVYVVSDSSKMPGSINLTNEFASSMGVYPKDGKDAEVADDGAEGILIVKASPFFLTAMNGFATTNPDAQSSQASQLPPFTDLLPDPLMVRDRMNAMMDQFKPLKITFQDIRDQYAKLKFLQAKYEDRMGQLTTYFNPKWVPGTTGSLYMRLPGSFKQFYVTGVTHNIAKHAPNSGTATTTVSFCSVRQGTTGKIPGIKQDDLFQYSQDKMKMFQQSWIADISP
jgi:hypothetical protein